VHGLVDTDYRCYPSGYRGDILLHASACRGGTWGRDQLYHFKGLAPAWEDLPFGQVVGLVDLCDCLPGSSGEWVWRFRNPRPFAPWPLKAGKRLFEVEDGLFRKFTGPPRPRGRPRKH
jgi:hypothetical protein